MKLRTVAKRYAKAMSESIRDDNEYRGIKGELELVSELLAVNATFKSGMETLILSKKQKLELLDFIDDRLNLDSKTRNFLNCLVEENRMMFLDQIIDFLEGFWFLKKGIEKLTVFSVILLDDRQRDHLVRQLEQSFKKKIIIENRLDPSVIGGIKIQRESTFYDFSIEGNLKKLRDMLTEISIPESLVEIGEGDANKG
jgi:F-type H+-transporting ATPase subunit delta